MTEIVSIRKEMFKKIKALNERTLNSLIETKESMDSVINEFYEICNKMQEYKNEKILASKINIKPNTIKKWIKCLKNIEQKGKRVLNNTDEIFEDVRDRIEDFSEFI
ncbi:MAG: hypothetical protein ACTSUV_05655 [Candidatus Ranarchaeia archaeon]